MQATWMRTISATTTPHVDLCSANIRSRPPEARIVKPDTWRTTRACSTIPRPLRSRCKPHNFRLVSLITFVKERMLCVGVSDDLMPQRMLLERRLGGIARSVCVFVHSRVNREHGSFRAREVRVGWQRAVERRGCRDARINRQKLPGECTSKAEADHPQLRVR